MEKVLRWMVGALTLVCFGANAESLQAYVQQCQNELHFNASAFELIENGAERFAIVDDKRELGKLLVQRDIRVIADTSYLSALIIDGERFQNIVHFRRFEIELRRFSGGEITRAFEISDAVLVKHNCANG